MVWEGRHREAPPYPDQSLFPAGISIANSSRRSRWAVVNPHLDGSQVRAFATFGVGRVEIVGDPPIPDELVLDRPRLDID